MSGIKPLFTARINNENLMSSLSDKAVEIATSYMGPAGKRFLERQTISHMNRLPLERIENNHLVELAKWVEISAGLLLDPGSATEFAKKIRSLLAH